MQALGVAFGPVLTVIIVSLILGRKLHQIPVPYVRWVATAVLFGGFAASLLLAGLCFDLGINGLLSLFLSVTGAVTLVALCTATVTHFLRRCGSGS